MKPLRTLAILIIMVLPPVFTSGSVAADGGPVIAGTEQIHLLVGRSTVVRTDRAITRVSLSTADIADAIVTAPHEFIVHGKAPGTISVLVWADNGRITNYEVVVRRDLTPLEGQMRAQFPQEPITVAVNGKDVVLSGVVSGKNVVDRAKLLAIGYVEKPENVVNLLRQQESMVTDQVMLKVRFAEVSRSAMQELGANFFTGVNGSHDWIARSTTQQYAAPEFDRDKGLVFSDFLNLFAFNTEEQLGTVIRALKGRGLFQSLAEPNLITQDGREASFLAGGEYPYPVVQGTAGSQSITIVFKEFGVRLRFTPTLTGQGFIHLKVMPEVSTLDFGNAVVLEGFRVPALSTRRTETEVELRDGQTFAIAGLIDRNMNETLRRVPGIGDIPILGYLFRSQAYQKNATELVVMITPHIVRRDSPGVTPNLPGLVEPLLPNPTRTIPMPPPAFGNPAPNAPGGPARTVVSNTTTNVAPATTRAAGEVSEKEQELQRVQAQMESRRVEERAQQAAKTDAAVRKVETERLARDRKLEEKRLEQQAAVDRKRWLEQQEKAARTKEVASKLAKEKAKRDAEKQKIDNERREEERKLAEKHQKAQEKLAREQETRDAELKKLLTQYQRLTGEAK